MHHYERETPAGKVKWKPEDAEIAEEAVVEIAGEVGATVTSSEADQIRATYRRLHVEKHGTDSPYHGGEDV